MRYLLIQPYTDGARRFEQATVVAEFDTLDEAFDLLGWYAQRLEDKPQGVVGQFES